MIPNRSNTDDSGGAVLTLVRLLGSRNEGLSEAEAEEVYYSDWTPKKAKSSRRLRKRTAVIGGPPSVIFVKGEGQPSQVNQWANLPVALLSVALFIYGVPTALKFFAFQHFSPWISTILPGDIAGCVWLATISRMRLLGLFLYIFLTASESGLYAFDLIDAGDLVWLTDLVPALFVAGVMTTGSKRAHA